MRKRTWHNSLSASSRWYVFNASIRQSPEALNRRKGTGNRRTSVGVDQFSGVEIMMGQR